MIDHYMYIIKFVGFSAKMAGFCRARGGNDVSRQSMLAELITEYDLL
jgi:hypothetical protein